MIPTQQKMTAPRPTQGMSNYEQSAYDHATRTLDPQFEQARKRFDQTMINKGLDPSSEAYKTEFDNFNRAKNDAYNSARFGAMQHGLQKFSTMDNINRAYADQKYRDAVFNASREDTKYNQLAGLMGGIPVPGATPLNVTGAYDRQYQGQLADWQNKMSDNRNMWNNVANIGAAAIMRSSKDVKDNKKPIDHSKLAEAILKLPVEQWEYKGESEKHVGPYAEDFNMAIGKGPLPMINQMDMNGAMLAAMKDFDKRLKNKGAA